MMLSGLRFVVEAWILFDADGSGSIEKYVRVASSSLL
jgi:hypothetical protein